MPASELVALLGSENRTPTSVPNTADANNFGSDTTPTLEFTGTDEEGNDIRYEIEIADDSLLLPTVPDIRSSSQNSGTTGTDLNVSVPAGAQVGDKIIVAAVANGQTTIVDNNGGTPFNEEINDYQPNTSNGITISIFSRVLQAGDPTTFHFTSGASGRWAIVAICPKGSQFDVAPSTGNAANVDDTSSGSISAPAITVANKSIHIVIATWDTAAIGTITTPSGYTLLQNANGGGEPLHASYKYFATGGSTGAVTCDNSEFGARIAISFSIKSKTTVYLDKVSGTDSGFANTVSGGDTDPFNSGEKVSFTVQAGDALPAGTYYWRARAKDPSGSENWSDWTTARSFSISSGTAANDARSARITGRDTANNSRSARITGKDTSNDNRSGRISGRDSANASRGGRITGIDSANSSRSSRITGTDSAADVRGGRITGANGANDNRGARLTGTAADNSSRSARVAGKLSDSSDRGGRVTGKESATDTRTGRIAGRAQAVDTRGARVSGRDTANASRGGRITGNANVSDARGGRVTGTATTSNERGARISGKNTLQESRGGRITGTDNATATREARISGRATAEDIMAGRIAGKDTKTDAREARVTGSITETDQREARVSGQDVGFDTIGARVAGKETAEDVRGARITGFIFETVFNVRGATITGVRRNPYTKKQAQYSDSEEKYQARVSPYTGW